MVVGGVGWWWVVVGGGGWLQCDPEPAWKAIAEAEAVTGEVGGLSLRKTPEGWKQAQGSVGNMQATLYGQIKALRLELLNRYNVELSVHSALFTWLVRHSQWLVNRYLQNSEGKTAFERRWGKRCNGFLCRRVDLEKPCFSDAFSARARFHGFLAFC